MLEKIFKSFDVLEGYSASFTKCIILTGSLGSSCQSPACKVSMLLYNGPQERAFRGIKASAL